MENEEKNQRKNIPGLLFSDLIENSEVTFLVRTRNVSRPYHNKKTLRLIPF
jgi:hypothetical protein